MLSLRVSPAFGLNEKNDPKVRQADEQSPVTTFHRNTQKTVGAMRDKQLSGRGSPGGKSVPYTEQELREMGFIGDKSGERKPKFGRLNTYA